MRKHSADAVLLAGALIGWAMLLLSGASCAPTPVSSGDAGNTVGADTGSLTDGGPGLDSGSPGDSGLAEPDAGSPSDGGPGDIDSGSPGDSGIVPTDAGSPNDSGPEGQDGGLPEDAGSTDLDGGGSDGGILCPDSAPSSGDSCERTSPAVCTYGTSTCTCALRQWVCGTCPSTLPVNDSMCTTAGLSCDYQEAQCLCVRAAGPGPSAWHCAGTCPEMQPTPGDPCNTGNMTCAYGSTNCLCISGSFFCN